MRLGDRGERGWRRGGRPPREEGRRRDGAGEGGGRRGGWRAEKCVCRGYSGSSWESSFDSQCLEIIRGRGGPGVATATANQRAKKNFSFYIAHFSVLAPRKRGSRSRRGSGRWNKLDGVGGTVGGGREPRSADRRRGGLPSRSEFTPTEDNVCRDTLKHVEYTLRSADRGARSRARAHVVGVGDRRRETPRNLDCTLPLRAAALVFTVRCERALPS